MSGTLPPLWVHHLAVVVCDLARAERSTRASSDCRWCGAGRTRPERRGRCGSIWGRRLSGRGAGGGRRADARRRGAGLALRRPGDRAVRAGGVASPAGRGGRGRRAGERLHDVRARSRREPCGAQPLPPPAGGAGLMARAVCSARGAPWWDDGRSGQRDRELEAARRACASKGNERAGGFQDAAFNVRFHVA